jgi:hypothetical protein
MSQYMLSVHHDPADDARMAALTPDEMQEIFQAVDAVNAELMAADAWVFGGGLHEKDATTTVRLKDGETLVTDGPYAETKEQLGGYYVIEARDLNEAIRVAARIPGARLGCVEVRPIAEDAQTKSALRLD